MKLGVISNLMFGRTKDTVLPLNAKTQVMLHEDNLTSLVRMAQNLAAPHKSSYFAGDRLHIELK